MSRSLTPQSSRRSVFTRGAFRSLLTLGVSAGAWSFGARTADADTLWNVTTGDFNVAANWSAGVPNPTQNAFVNNGGTCSISSNGSTFDCNTGTAASTSGTYSMTGGTLSVYSWFRQGAAAGSTGVFTVAAGTLNNSVGLQTGSNFNIGESGTGTLTIGGGAAAAAVTVKTSTLLQVARDTGSVGTMNVNTNGTFTYANTGTVGAPVQIIGERGTGTLNVNGGVYTSTATAANGGALTVGGTTTAADTTAGRGTINLSAGSITTAAQLLLGTNNGAAGTINVTGGIFTVNSYTSIGTQNGGTGTVSVSAGSFNVTGDLNVSDVASSKGTLNISNTGVVRGSTTYIGKSTGSTGLVNQSGGSYTQTSGNDFRLGSGTIAANGTGFWNLSGGTVTTPANMQVGYSSNGYLNQTGGTFSVGTFASIGRLAGAFGTVDVSGGTFNQVGTGNKIIVGELGDGNVTVRGTGVITTAGGLTIGLGDANASTRTAVFNLDTGGTLNTPLISPLNGAPAAATNPYVRIFNFNGGTLVNTAASTNFFNNITTANVFSGGATFNTVAGSITVGQSLVAPAGNGLATIPVTNGGAGYATAPIVKVTGDGVGATAVANLTGGVITSFTITNPGTGYTTAPTITLVTGLYTPTTAATVGTATIAANTSGGLVKNGANTLTLGGTNTFTGGITVNGGTLQAGSVGAFPQGSALTNNGATVDFNNQFTQGPGSVTPGLMLSSLTTGNNSKFLFTLSSTGVSYVAISGAATIGSGNTITVSALAGQTLQAGSYNLFTAASGDLSTITLANNFVITGGNYYPLTYSATPTADVLTIGTGQVARIFYSGANGTSLNSTSNYTTDSAGAQTNASTPAGFTDVVFSSANAANTTPTVDSPLTVNSLEFATTAAVTVGGASTLTLSAQQNTFAAGTGIVVDAGAGADTIAANLSLPTSESFTNNSSNVFTISGGISSTNAGTTLTLAGAGGFTLSGNNTYTGSTVINAGTVTLGSGTALGAAANNTVLNGGVLAFNGQTVTQNSLTLAGGTVSALNPPTGLLTLASTGVALNITATYANPVSTPTVASNLAFNGGTIAKATGNGTPVFAGGIALNGTGATFALADSPGDAAAELTLTGVVSGTGALTINDLPNPTGVTLANNFDFGTLALSNANTYGGGTNITSGRIVVTNGSALGTGLVTIAQNAAGNSTLAGGSAGGVLSLGNSAYTATTSPLAPGAIATGITIANNINLGGQVSGNYGYGLYNDSGANTLSGVITLTNANQIVNVNGTSSLAFSNTVGQSNGVTAGLTKIGTGTLIVAGTATYGGNTAVNTGTLSLTGTLANSPIIVATAGTFTEGATGLISGTGALTTSGTTTLGNNANSYTGATTLLAGTLTVADIENGGVPSTIGASTAAPANLVLAGNSTLAYTGASTTTNRGFTVGATGTAGGTTINTANDLTFGGQILAANSASFTKLGAGTLTFTNAGTNTFNAGNTGNGLGFDVNQGVVNIGGTQAAPVASTNVFNAETDVGTINSATSPNATLNFNGGTSSIGTYLTAGRGNGTNNAASFINFNNSAVVTSNQLAIGFNNSVAGYSSSPTLNFNDNSSYTETNTTGAFRFGESANAAGVTTVNVNGNASVTANSTTEFFVGYQGPAIFNQNGGTVTAAAPLTLAQNTAGSTGTYNLNGGTLTVPRVAKGAGTGTFVFNGGTLRPSVSDNPGTTTFFTGPTANVANGGANINTNGFTVTVASALAPSAGSTGGLTVTGTGAAGDRLNLTALDSYTGATSVTNSILAVDNGSTTPVTTAGRLSATSGITANAGGTLLLAGAAGVNDRLNDAATFTLAGGTFNLNNLSEGAAGTNGVGALTLTATSTLDFGSPTGATSNLVQFGGVGSHTGMLTITDYDAGATQDHLYFAGMSSSFDYAQGNVTFNGVGGYTTTDFGAYFEVSPTAVPEPATWLAGGLTLGLFGYGQRRRVSAWLGLRRAA